MKLLVIIPSYNAARNLHRLIPETKKYVDKVLVVDDGSEDDTYFTALNLGAKSIQHRRNMGKGAALKTGFQYAIENNYDFVITIDSDLQHYPQNIGKLIDYQSRTGADILIGARLDRSRMPWDRRFSNWITSGIISRIVKMNIMDSQSGLRMLSIKLIKNLELRSNRFELESEIIIKAARKGYQIAFVPVETIYPDLSKSKINRVVDTVRWIYMIARNL